MKKFTLTVITVVYLILVITIISIFLNETVFKEKPTERFFEVPKPVQELVKNLTPAKVVETMPAPKFYSAPKFKLNYAKGLIVSPYVKNVDYIAAIQDAKRNGANLVTIALDMEVSHTDGPEFPSKPYGFDWKSTTITMINEAHKRGMKVELRTTAVPDTRYPGNITLYTNNAQKFFVGLGDFAQEYQVAMLTIYENIEDDRNFGLHKDKIDVVLQDFIVNATKFYKGEVGVGFSDTTLVDVGKIYNMAGYDYIILNAYPIHQKVPWGDLHLRIGELIKIADRIKLRHGVKKAILGGFGANSNPTPFYYVPITVSEEDEARVYDIIFEKHSNKVDGMIVAYSTKMYGVKGKPAEKIVEKWFRKLS